MSIHITLARQTAAARGFTSVKHWMQENRKAYRGFSSRLSAKGEDKARLRELMKALDSDYDQFSRFI